MYCQFCGSSISSKKPCPDCGAILPKLNIPDATSTVLCTKCGRPNNLMGKYCWQCGTPLNKDDALNGFERVRQQALKTIEKYKESQNVQGGSMKYNKKDVRIGLWGPTSAGKTVYLLSLYIAAMQNGSDWLIGFDENTSQGKRQFMMASADALRAGNWPDPTEKTPDPELYGLLFYPPPDRPAVKIKKVENDPLSSFWRFFTEEPAKDEKREERGLHVSFADVSGESYLDEPADSVLWQHLAGCQGLICLLDPDPKLLRKQLQITGNLVDFLYAKVKREKPEAIINGQYLPHYVSVCFTKMDRPEWQSMMQSPEGVMEKIYESTDLSIQRQLWVHFAPDRLKFHCISSVGSGFKASNTSSSKGSEVELSAHVKPQYVFSPLNDWIDK